MQTCTPHLMSVLVFCFALSLDVLYMRFGSKDLISKSHELHVDGDSTDSSTHESPHIWI